MLLRTIISISVFISVLLISRTLHAEEPVGIILPLTGAGGFLGQACLNGITLAREELGEKLRGKVNFVIEDDQNSPVTTVSALRSIQQKTKAQIFLTLASNTSKAVNQLAEREGFILFAVATDPEVARGKKNVFRYWVSAATEVRKLLEALKRRNIFRIAAFTAQQDALLSLRNTLRDLAPEYGVQILGDEEFPTQVQDFRSGLVKLRKTANLQGVFNNLYVGQSGIFARQARDLGLSLPLFAVELYEDQSVLDAAQGALEGQFYINASDGTSEFVKRFRGRFPESTLFSAANCYDFISFLSAAPGLSADAFRKFLYELRDYPGMVGRVSSMGDQSFTLPAVEKVVRGGEFETVVD